MSRGFPTVSRDDHLEAKLLASDCRVCREIERIVLMGESVGHELSQRHANRVLVAPVVGAIAEDEREFVQRELSGMLVNQDRKRGRGEHVGIFVGPRSAP